MRMFNALAIVLLFASVAPAQYIESSQPSEVESLEAQIAELKAENESLRAQLRALPAKEPTPAEPVNKITLVSMENCKWCPVAKAYHESRYKAAGWGWSERSEGRGKQGCSYPYYEVCVGDRCHTIQCGVYELDDRIRQLIKPKKKLISQSSGHVTPSVRGMTIEYHLTQHHGVDITGMSVAEMEAKHLEEHRKIDAANARRWRR